MAQVTLFKYLIISNNYFTMNGFTDKDAILVIFCANILIYLWQSHIWCKNCNFFETGQNIDSFASATKGMDNFLSEKSMKWRLHLLTSEMSIDMGSSIVHWLGKVSGILSTIPTFDRVEKSIASQLSVRTDDQSEKMFWTSIGTRLAAAPLSANCAGWRGWRCSWSNCHSL